MKHRFFLASFCTLMAGLSLLAPAAHADTDSWDIARARPADSKGVVTIPGSSERGIRIEDHDITVADDPDAPGGRALMFSGKQSKPALGSKVFESAGSAVVKFQVKPDSAMDADPQTVLARPGAYELRYTPRRGDMELFVTYQEKSPPVSVRVPVAAGKWNHAEVTIKDGVAMLTIDDKTATQKLPEGAKMGSARSYLRFGSMDQTRPFKGMLAEISVTEPAD